MRHTWGALVFVIWACAGGPCGERTAAAPTSPSEPAFSDSKILQISDSRGRTRAFAVSSDGSVWHLAETADASGWKAEWLGGNAVGMPAATYDADGLLRIWIVGPDHAVRSTKERSGGGWTEWRVFEAPPAVDVTGLLRPMNSQVVVVRG